MLLPIKSRLLLGNEILETLAVTKLRDINGKLNNKSICNNNLKAELL